jgi:hypothetical protein
VATQLLLPYFLLTARTGVLGLFLLVHQYLINIDLMQELAIDYQALATHRHNQAKSTSLLGDGLNALMVLLAHCLLGEVVAELAGNAVVAGAGSEFVEGDVAALLGGAEAAREAVGAVGEAVAALGRNVLVGGHVIGARPWELILRSLAPSQHSSEVSHAAVFVLGAEVLPVLCDGEGNEVLSWSRHSQLLLVLQLDLARQGVTNLGALFRELVVAGAWVLVLDGGDEGSSDHHPLSTFSEGKAVLLIGSVIKVVGVRGRGGGRLAGEVVLVSVSEAGASGGDGVLDVIEAIAAG